ncbi:glycoside hydrolase family 3 C-terminal domain-containing protein [Cellvibrio sp. OA-2007]|uniref:glycoside hydrolase family 3 C-terminal domain-containing protein n=1 Tax=Cellvibrio sp. OA-2007 TaxID=529823 RepID=UPI0007844913|nr:glycoside hydrolase family 3 C-terminal domain-containing protein [Cellvibrio sp. OA-2007]
MIFSKKLSAIAVACALYGAPFSNAQDANTKAQPWMNTGLSATERTQLVLKEMTMDEKLSLLVGYFGTDAPWKNFTRPVESHPQSAGFIYGVPRLGIPHIWQADAGIGVASQGGPNVRERTALPSGMTTAATWNPQVGFEGGAMIGSEARTSGFNVLLAGGVNLVREPRNGRNFEYGGEDPLLAGVMVGAQIKGVQSNNIVSTLKHFAYNDQESGRFHLNVTIDEAAGRMSDLLALQFAYEIGNPGSVMCSYNRVYGVYGCESEYLLNEVLKKDWGFKGWVMSDWGATHSTVPAANNGLDQQSGLPFDHAAYFKEPLKEAVTNGWVTQARLDDMAGRVLHALFEHGVMDNPVPQASNNIDFKKHGLISQKDAEEGMVLLRNEKVNGATLLPLAKELKKIAIIGSHANVGVLSGGGSSQVYPVGGMAIKGLGPKVFPGPMVYYPSSPMKALAARYPNARISFDEGTNPQAAAKLAAESDVVIVFANQWTAESVDVPNLSLPDNQDALIASVAKANTKTVVVLQTGGAVLMPWLKDVGAVVEAWYPGTNGGEAITRVLSGEVNPSGHLPITFPAAESQLPRAIVDGSLEKPETRFEVDYFEGAAVGYKWFELKNHQPLFPFGFGLSYTDFAYSDLKTAVKNGQLSVSFSVKNTGAVAGKDVAQVYVAPKSAKWEAPKRLGAFHKVDLKPGESTSVTVNIDPRLLAMYQSKDKTWKIAKGEYEVILAKSTAESQTSVKVKLPARTLDVNGK